MAKKRKRKGRIKSKAQRRKFAALLVEGKIKPQATPQNANAPKLGGVFIVLASHAQ